MIKRLLVGAALGVFGKKLYDEGKLDPYIEKAKQKLAEQGLSRPSGEPSSKSASAVS